MRRITHALLSAGVLGGLLVAAPAFADTAKPAAPTLGDVLNASGISLTGYVDATYTYFNSYPGTTMYGSSAEPQRQFDYRKNSFALNQAAITASYLPTSGFGALVNLIAGSDGRVLRNTEISNGSTTNSPLDIYQAYAQYATGPVTLLAGKFATLAGAETVNPTTDSTVSRSLLFFNLEPLSHTGVRAVYTGGMGSVTLGVNNGWNYTSAPNYNNGVENKTVGKTFEIGGSLTPNKVVSLAGAIYTGDAATGGTGGKGRLTLYDAVATITATDALTFVINGDYKKQDNFSGSTSAVGKGIAAYATYAFTPEWSMTVRGEYVDDNDGMLTGVSSTTIKEGTLAVNYTPSAHVILRGEVRQDRANNPIFYASAGNLTKTSQTSVALEAIYKF